MDFDPGESCTHGVRMGRRLSCYHGCQVSHKTKFGVQRPEQLNKA